MKENYGGIVDEDEYKKASPKIMVLLKEANDKENGPIIPYVKKISETGKFNTTWRNVNELLSIIFNNKNENHIKKVAVSNINKCKHSNVSNPGRTPQKKLEKILKDNVESLKNEFLEEINEFKPDIIICGNVHFYLKHKEYFNLELIDVNFILNPTIGTPKTENLPHGIYTINCRDCREIKKQILVIGLYHPAYRRNERRIINCNFLNDNIDIIKNYI